MEPRLVRANSLVEENRNQAAVERGPLVYCVESCDILQPCVEPEDLLIPLSPGFTPQSTAGAIALAS